MLVIDDSWQGQGPVLYPLDFMDRPQVVNAGCLFLSRAIPVTDEQFMNLKAGSVSINSKSITDRCINQFIKNWVNGKCVESFTQYTFKSQAMERVTAVILQGVQQSIALSGPDQFFCCSCEKPCGRGDYYVIPSLVDPNDYISVFFCAHYMVIAFKGAEQESLIRSAGF
ncbi:F-box associated domain-containing protein [Caenorhabditis elegans]|uniref:F-box associated domain-containing protein n=1 Tax=Caenorhabditis elegans TaxID=6239 RepID=G5EGD9_CAEEL|nr:FBA_2 domain-containing protein [Caenorhabditis elegans]CAB04409.2 FBA_2 domain-containing protein [Caenorhabditis elegans]|eukprot:NP_507985.2 Uncharacterized protein CELE_F46B3.16 [Caenorhabditis elegans]